MHPLTVVFAFVSNSSSNKIFLESQVFRNEFKDVSRLSYILILS